MRFLNLDIEASCEEDPDIMEIQPVRETAPWHSGSSRQPCRCVLVCFRHSHQRERGKKQKIADSVVMFGQMLACTDAKERAQAGDLLLLSLPRERVVEMISKQERGIRVRSLHASQALSEQSEFVELVLSSNSPLLGQPICTLDYK